MIVHELYFESTMYDNHETMVQLCISVIYLLYKYHFYSAIFIIGIYALFYTTSVYTLMNLSELYRVLIIQSK